MTKLFVGGLPYSMTNEELREVFSPYGTIITAEVVFDRYTNKSKGFGFVEMENDEEAQKAIATLNGSNVGGRSLSVSVARPKEERPPRDGGFGGGYNRGNFNRNDRRDRGGFGGR